MFKSNWNCTFIIWLGSKINLKISDFFMCNYIDIDK
jgi:hypothetical protein